MKDCIVCRCEGVYLSEIKESIHQGAHSVPGVKMRNRVGMGPCQGRVCQPILNEIFSSELGEDFKPHLQRAQTPVRPTLMKDM